MVKFVYVRYSVFCLFIEFLSAFLLRFGREGLEEVEVGYGDDGFNVVSR